jgi:hypothetical protein
MDNLTAIPHTFRRLFSGAALLLLAACDSPIRPIWLVPMALQEVHGDSQSAVVGHPLSDSLVVRAVSRRGEPLAGVTVDFRITSGGGVLTPEKVRTDAGGFARAAWTLGVVAGEQGAEALIEGSQIAPVVFTATAAADSAVQIVPASGDGQTGTVGEPLGQPLVVQALDEHGNGVPGVGVVWSTNSGSIEPEADQTDGSGLASARWTLGTDVAVGATTIASSSADSVVFAATAAAGALHEVRIEPDSIITLHRSVVQVAAAAFDVHGNPAEPSQPVIWTTSDQGVATVALDPANPRRATISTKGTGIAIIGASVGDVAAEMPLVVAGIVEGSYRAVHTGLRTADAFNDHGEIVVHEGGLANTTLTRWKDGRLAVQKGVFGNYAIAAAINGAGEVLIRLNPCCNTGLAGWREIWLIRDSVATRVAWTAVPYDISDSGVVVGAVQDSHQFRFRAAAWVNGALVRFSDPHDPTWISEAVAVNDRGQVAVNTRPNFDSGLNMTRTYLWAAGEYSLVPAPDPRCSGWSARDLNRDGTLLLGCAMQDGSSASFLWDGHAVTSLAPIRGVGLNDRGEVVGLGPEGVYHWQAGRAIRLFAHSAGPLLVRINNAGQILLGTAFGVFLLQPDP